MTAEIDISTQRIAPCLAPGVDASALDLLRTEDCRFSPDGRLLAVAGFAASSISLYSVETRPDTDGKPRLWVTGAVQVTHPAMAYPHGLDFIDNHSLAIANRKGKLMVIDLPRPPFSNDTYAATAQLQLDRATRTQGMISPGSVAVETVRPDRYNLLVCLNYPHKVTRQVIRRSGSVHRRLRGRIVLKRGLNIPDGISICPTTRRLAISNHFEHAVRLYRSPRWLTRWSKPVGRLLGVTYPHGLRFCDGGRMVLVADAGNPFVHFYRDETARWRGNRHPVASFRIMDQETFLRGQNGNPQEGGPKGIDVHPGGDIVMLTSEELPAALFDLQALIRLIPPTA